MGSFVQRRANRTAIKTANSNLVTHATSDDTLGFIGCIDKEIELTEKRLKRFGKPNSPTGLRYKLSLTVAIGHLKEIKTW